MGRQHLADAPASPEMLERLDKEDHMVTILLHFEACRDDVGVDALTGQLGGVQHLVTAAERAVERIHHLDADVIGDCVRGDLG
jgi:hypothetical protein